ncbi:MAG: hypothetical protein KJO09_05035 [Gammaproteobacteria bacterium]|nr:hypothetical protein [Gammaproteobacteria bacterium]
MKNLISKSALVMLALLAGNTASADFGVGLKAGTLGLGLEGRWSALPWLDVRVGVNSFEYDDDGSQAGINYDATFSLDSFYATGNFRFPLSPFRVTAGVVSNGNEFVMASQDSGDVFIDIGDDTFNTADVGTLQSTTSFSSTAPYLGVGYDFEIFGKVGLNLDFGVLWQGEPEVTLEATGLESAPAAVQSVLTTELENERLALEDEMSDFKAWPVVSIGFIYNF